MAQYTSTKVHDIRKIEGDDQGIAHVTHMLKSLHSDPLTPKFAAPSRLPLGI